MCMTNEAAAIKLAERDNLVGELVEQLKRFSPWVIGSGPSMDHWKYRSEWLKAEALISRVEKQGDAV